MPSAAPTPPCYWATTFKASMQFCGWVDPSDARGWQTPFAARVPTLLMLLHSCLPRPATTLPQFAYFPSGGCSMPSSFAILYPVEGTSSCVDACVHVSLEREMLRKEIAESRGMYMLSSDKEPMAEPASENIVQAHPHPRAAGTLSRTEKCPSF